MQQVKFNSIVEFFEYLPPNEAEMTHILRDVVRETLPEIKEKLTYNVPFYKLKKTICFIWPGSVLWGKTRKYTGVRFGFAYGAQLDPLEKDLKLEQRKKVAYLHFNRAEDLDLELIRHYLRRSVELDEGF